MNQQLWFPWCNAQFTFFSCPRNYYRDYNLCNVLHYFNESVNNNNRNINVSTMIYVGHYLKYPWHIIHSIIRPFLVIPPFSQWLNFLHVFSTCASLIFLQILVVVALKSSTNGHSFLQAKLLLHVCQDAIFQRIQIGQFGRQIFLPKKLVMFSLSYSCCVFFAILLRHIICIRKRPFVHESTLLAASWCRHQYWPSDFAEWILFFHWMSQPKHCKKFQWFFC